MLPALKSRRQFSKAFFAFAREQKHSMFRYSSLNDEYGG